MNKKTEKELTKREQQTSGVCWCVTKKKKCVMKCIKCYRETTENVV